MQELGASQIYNRLTFQVLIPPYFWAYRKVGRSRLGHVDDPGDEYAWVQSARGLGRYRYTFFHSNNMTLAFWLARL